MKAIRDNAFHGFETDETSFVYEIVPDVHTDGRGSFSEVLKTQPEWSSDSEFPIWMSNFFWLRQINRSVSSSGVIRGFHAQRGMFCQGKMVESVNGLIFDAIVDARPDSRTFGKAKAYVLDPDRQNKVWIPRGFLHSFITPLAKFDDTERFIFSYYVDNTYNRESETGVNPSTLLPKVLDGVYSDISKGIVEPNIGFLVDTLNAGTEKLNMSEKDMKAVGWDEFSNSILDEYNKTGKVWYR